MAGTAPPTTKKVYRDITFKSADNPPPWSDIHEPDYGKLPPWAPRKILTPPVFPDDAEGLPGQHRVREFPRGNAGPSQQDKSREESKEEKAEGSWWGAKLRRWLCMRKRRERQAAEASGLSQALLRDSEMGEEEQRVRRITPSCYNAMEIHGFFGLVDDGSCGAGRMLILHQPSWVRGQCLDIRDGDDIHVWHVAGTAGGVLRVLSTGRHRYYSPGQRVTTCTVCVPEEQWERLMQ